MTNSKCYIKLVICWLLASCLEPAYAELWLPAIFGDHMVLQRDHNNPVWGRALPEQTIQVRIDGQTHTAQSDSDGKWRLALDPMSAGGPFEMVVVAGDQTLTFDDILVGEVWMCSGQSNMQWALSHVNHAAVEIASANYPQIRLLTVGLVGSQEPQEDIQGRWQVCTPDTARRFSGIGYLFGRRIHAALGVPVGIINNAWGGSNAEAWIPSEILEKDPLLSDTVSHMQARSEAYTDEIHAKKLSDFQSWVESGRPNPQRRPPEDPRVGRHRPGNIYYGMLHPTIGYGKRGVIWYQGESNTTRAHQYQHLMTKVINHWREVWGQGDFPFYWVQLAGYTERTSTPQAGGWAFLREAQTSKLYTLRNVGETVTIDAGEGRDIHPRDKQTVADRLVRHALANDYGFDMASSSPRFKEMEQADGGVIITFDFIDEGLYAFDTTTVLGFTLAGEDRIFHNAQAQIVSRNQVKVFHPDISNPIAVRYGWASHPTVNLYDRNGLPVTPFRTDSW